MRYDKKSQRNRAHEREHPLTLEQKYNLLNSIYEEVKSLGKLTSKDSIEDIGHLIAMARVLNFGI
ncbi:MAG: hypothetical protein HYZ34_14025 [Ignavibacteriae bacterium]|nr:hypothetical protein [Ignavibacteriota bacterium]